MTFLPIVMIHDGKDPHCGLYPAWRRIASSMISDATSSQSAAGIPFRRARLINRILNSGCCILRIERIRIIRCFTGFLLHPLFVPSLRTVPFVERYDLCVIAVSGAICQYFAASLGFMMSR